MPSFKIRQHWRVVRAPLVAVHCPGSAPHSQPQLRKRGGVNVIHPVRRTALSWPASRSHARTASDEDGRLILNDNNSIHRRPRQVPRLAAQTLKRWRRACSESYETQTVLDPMGRPRNTCTEEVPAHPPCTAHSSHLGHGSHACTVSVWGWSTESQ
jgi:hypothetical protein